MSKEPINICANANCEKPIYEGDSVWKRGKDLFCHIKCVCKQLKEERAHG